MHSHAALRGAGRRTMLVVPELEHEMGVQESNVDTRHRIHALRANLHDLEEAADELRLKQLDLGDGAVEEDIARVALEREELKRELAETVLAYHRLFHRSWGQVFKTGYQNSRFAQQVYDYACLYSSRATNLYALSPDARFHTSADVMPHDWA